MQLKGIDVSYAQGKINWHKVKAAGIQFAMIRSSYGKNAHQIDAQLTANVEGCEAAGIPYGFYHYAYADTPVRARAEAAFFLDTIKMYNPTYPCAYDMEDTSLARLSRTAMSEVCAAFMDAVRVGGYRPMLYASASWLKNKLDMRALAGYDVWLAQWASAPTYGGEFTIWQSTETGKVDGISGMVDLNTAYVDYHAQHAKADVQPTDNTPDGYAQQAVEWALQHGILNGDERGDYRLRSNATRQEVLTFMHRMAQMR